MSKDFSRKIAFVSYSDCKGGAAKATWNLYKLVSQRQDGVSFYSVHRNHAETFPILSNKSKLIKFYVANALVRSYMRVLAMLRRIRNQKRSLNISGVFDLKANDCLYHLHWVHNETVSLQAVLNTTAPVIWTLHDSWFMNCVDNCDADYIGTTFFSNRISSLKYSICHKKNIIFTVPNSAAARRMKNIYGGIRCEVIPNVIGSDFISAGMKTYRSRGMIKLLFVATHVADPIKGWEVLCSALEMLDSATRLLIDLHVVGSTSKLDIAVPEGLGGFNSHGVVVSELSMSQIMKEVDYLVVASYSESFGLVAAEAMACGTPVLGTRTDGLRDLIDDGIEGFLFDIGSVHQLCELICKIGEMSAYEYGVMSESARAKALAYCSPSGVYEKMESLYKELLF